MGRKRPHDHPSWFDRFGHISALIAGRAPLPQILRTIAATAQELAQAEAALVGLFDPAEPPRFYGPDSALALGQPWFQALQGALPLAALQTTPQDGDSALVHFRVDRPAPVIPNEAPRAETQPTGSDLLTSITMPIFAGNELRGALATFHPQPPRNPPRALLTLLGSQARIAMETHQTYNSTIWALAMMVDRRDPYAHRHSQAVTDFAVALAQALGLSEEEINTIRYAAILHDVGKIGISEEILFKRGVLTPQERAAVEEHPRVAADILKSIPHMQDLIPLILHHHERYDGSGYPDRLCHGDPRLPLGAQILAIADTFDAITTERPYHRGLGILEACQFLQENAGTLFDPELVRVFIRMIYQRLGLDRPAE